jgi:diguanylate cyclase (GGDEF)-like protein
VPWAANAAYLGFGVRLLGGDPTPLSFAVAIVGFGWLIRSSSLINVVPMSRRLLFTALPDPVLVLDARGRVVDCNDAGHRLAGRDMPAGLPLAQWPVFGPALAELLNDLPAAEPAAAAGAGGTHGADGAADAHTLVLDTPGLVLDVKARPIGPSAQRIGWLLQLRDVTERHRTQTRLAGALAQRDEQLRQVARIEAELREQTLRDPLTGLLNRRALVQRFELEMQHHRATGLPLTLVLIDIDHFKRVNDTYGHGAGDALLEALGRTMTEGLRASDAVFRIGGEEFALLMPNADAERAGSRVQALRERAARRHVLPDGRSLTFSAGIATAGKAGTRMEELLASADTALYEAKAAGRDCSVVAS